MQLLQLCIQHEGLACILLKTGFFYKNTAFRECVH